MKKKQRLTVRVLVVAICATLLLSAVLALAACDGEGSIKYKDVGTVDELYAMEEGKSYRLTANIDLQNRFWAPKSVKAFDGNGYGISNCMITEHVQIDLGTHSAYNSNTAFFAQVSYLQDVFFDNVTVIVSTASQVAIVAAYPQAESWIRNVTVKNCSILGVGTSDITYLGIVCGRGSNLNSISNCLVEKCTIDCTLDCEYDAYVGGISGTCGEYTTVTNCTLLNSKIDVSSTDDATLNVGGIVGYNQASNTETELITDCLTQKSQFTVKSAAYASATTRVGGIVGYSADNVSNSGSISTRGVVARCASSNNTFDVSVQDNYTVGGIAGRSDGPIFNCLGDGNVFTAQSDNSTPAAYLGGICGLAYYTIRYCIVQQCNLHGTRGSGDKLSTAGLVARTDTSIASCAVGNTAVDGSKSDVFAEQNRLIFTSYVYGTNTTPNVNEVEVYKGEWNRIINALELDTQVWTIVEGKLSLIAIGAQL